MKLIKHPPVPGTKKIVKKFLLWPIRINNETRLFKTVTIQYEYVEYGSYNNISTNILKRREWIPIKFID